MTTNIRVGLCDDNSVFLKSLEEFINDTPGFEVVFSKENAENLEELIIEEDPGILLMDIDMPGKNGIEATTELHRLFPSLFILILTVYEDEDKIFAAVLSGASGYLLKKTEPEHIIQSIKDVIEGGASMSPIIVRKVLNHFSSSAGSGNSYELSPQEKKVLQCLVQGHSYKMIAADCQISLGTVRFHINSIYKKLHINSKSEAVAKALREKLT